MKLCTLIALMFPLVASATAHVTSDVDTPTVYTCHAYTDNSVVPGTTKMLRVATDNPVVNEVTTIVRWKQSYTVVENTAFKEELNLAKVSPDAPAGFASNTQAMLFLKRNDNFQPYFLIYTTDHPAKAGEEPSANPISRLVTVAQCTTE